MATVTRENIGLLNDKLTVNLSKEDYYGSFEKSLKTYAKNANLQGFRKGMVPAGLIKKMYGQGLFTEEILRTVEKELNNYMQAEKLDIFAQPLPIPGENSNLDMNAPGDYNFPFEIGLKPVVNINAEAITATRYKIQVTDKMLGEEVDRMQERFGKPKETETVENEKNLLELSLNNQPNEPDAKPATISISADEFIADKRQEITGKKVNETITVTLSDIEEGSREKFSSQISDDAPVDCIIIKITSNEKAEMNEEFFEAVFPGGGVKDEEEFKVRVKDEIEKYYEAQARNQVHDQIYHYLIDNTSFDFPENFLKRWLQIGGEKEKSPEEAENEYPRFSSQLKWTLISNKLITDNNIEVTQEEIRNEALRQISGYMGVNSLEQAPWLDEYVNRMMKDEKFMQNTYATIQTNKLFTLLEEKAQIKEEEISAEDFASKLQHHDH